MFDGKGLEEFDQHQHQKTDGNKCVDDLNTENVVLLTISSV